MCIAIKKKKKALLHENQQLLPMKRLTSPQNLMTSLIHPVKREKGESLIFIMLKKKKEKATALHIELIYIYMLMGPIIQ